MPKAKLIAAICIVSMVFLAVVITTTQVSAKSKKADASKCPKEGTEVPFAKLMNSGFMKQYHKCNVKTKVSFLTTTQKMGCYCCGAIKGFTNFQVAAPGQAGTKNPLTGAVQGEVAYVSNANSDLVFELKPGDLIELSGGVVVRDTSGGRSCAFFAVDTMKKVEK